VGGAVLSSEDQVWWAVSQSGYTHRWLEPSTAQKTRFKKVDSTESAIFAGFRAEINASASFLTNLNLTV
jgi:hypothetical protein